MISKILGTYLKKLCVIQGEGFGPTAFLNGNDATGVATAENRSALAPSYLLAPGPSQAGSLVQVIAAAPPEYIPEAALQTSQGCMAVHSCAIHYAPAIHHAHTKVSFQA